MENNPFRNPKSKVFWVVVINSILFVAGILTVAWIVDMRLIEFLWKSFTLIFILGMCVTNIVIIFSVVYINSKKGIPDEIDKIDRSVE